MNKRTLTGRHVLAMFVGGFGIIIAVNITLAVNAVRTFPGLEVANSYIASQTFDTLRAAQDALGWQVETHYSDETLRLILRDHTGKTMDPTGFTARVGRPTTGAQDQWVTFTADGHADLTLHPGRWRIDLQSPATLPTFSHRLILWVRE